MARAGTPALDPALRGVLERTLMGRRCVFVAGLPATGKSVLVRQLASLASEHGRSPRLLRWDVARLAFDTPAILSRYPEVGGVTHAAIRLAVGRWARATVLRWHREHGDPCHILIGETPLIGERLMELARPRDDALEPLLASDRTAFVVPVPSREVRRAIEDARASDMSEARDPKSAPPDLVRAHWSEIEHVAVALGGGPPRVPGEYDPDLYADAYARLLHRRHTVIAPITHLARANATPLHDEDELVPAPEEVAAAIGEVERLPSPEIERLATDWYR